jgi:hypothetical protein
VVNPIQGQNPWLAVPSAGTPAVPATPFDPAQLLDHVQTAAGTASSSLYGQDPSGLGNLLGSDISTADPTVAAAMAALQGLNAASPQDAGQVPPSLPAMGADAINSYLAAAAGSDAGSSSDTGQPPGTDFYV